MYRHYIRINEASEVIAAFSNAFETPLPDDICITPDGTGERHFNMQLQEQGDWVWLWKSDKLVRKTAKQIAASATYKSRMVQMEIDQHLAYLASTDWYATRAAETAIPIPTDILMARQSARTLISDLRSNI